MFLSIKESLKQLLNDHTSSIRPLVQLFNAIDGALYLFGSGGHVDYVLNAVVKEVPGVLEVWRRILDHHQLCGVIDTCQSCPFGVPVHLYKKEVVQTVHIVSF